MAGYNQRVGGELPAVGVRDRHTAGGIVVEIDTRQIQQLLAALKTVDLARHDFVMRQAMNEGADRLYTQAKRILQDITGIRLQKRVTKGFRKLYARAGKWEAGLKVEDEHTRITKEYYGATWNRSMPGARHFAWNRSQIATGAFMAYASSKSRAKLRAGKKLESSDNDTQIVFKRLGPDRLPIKSLWGPNMAREMDREPGRSRIEAKAVQIARDVIVPEAYRLIGREMDAVKGKVGK